MFFSKISPSSMKKIISCICLVLLVVNSNAQLVGNDDLKWSQPELHKFWRSRIDSFLNKGVIPIIDMESTLGESQSRQLSDPAVINKMDELGIALIAFDDNKMGKILSGNSYQWSNHMMQYVNKHPDRFIPTTNAGTSGFLLDKLEQEVKTGKYSLIGEFEFRHYVSSEECREGKFNREASVPINSELGHRLFKISSDTGLAFLIHNEPEDAGIEAFSEMLAKYPKAKVIQAHFGQIRYPNRETKFNADLARNLLEKYPNLYFDISVGKPGRRYKCQGQDVIDTVIWQTTPSGQTDTLKPEYLKLFNDYSDRFVSGFDYGGGRPPIIQFWGGRVNNIHLIIRDLSEEARHNISYKNAWKILTNSDY